MQTNAFPLVPRIRISWRWASKQINCTVAGILSGCMGKCCTGTAYWPSKANGNRCAHLTESGCGLSALQKPTVCLLYPFVIKNGALVLHGRALVGCCKPNYTPGSGPSIFEHLGANLITMFGDDQYRRALASIKAERDSYFDLTPALISWLAVDAAAEEANKIPDTTTRSYEETKAIPGAGI